MFWMSVWLLPRHGARMCCRRAFSKDAPSPASTSVDPEEVRKFGELSTQWADENGPFKALHSLNQLRVPWILKSIGDLKGKRVADIGSGGGLLSVPLARSGLEVVGVDATAEAVKAARLALDARPLKMSGISDRVSYTCTTVEDFAKENNNAFDAVVASEILEHVSDLSSFVTACVGLAKPGAPLFFTTINKTVASRLTAIWLAEDVLGLVPQGVHEWDKFVPPSQLSSLLSANGCSTRSIQGFTYHPLANRWQWIGSTAVNYALMAVKNR